LARVPIPIEEGTAPPTVTQVSLDYAVSRVKILGHFRAQVGVAPAARDSDERRRDVERLVRPDLVVSAAEGLGLVGEGAGVGDLKAVQVLVLE
jgi:hypothetical protein